MLVLVRGAHAIEIHPHATRRAIASHDPEQRRLQLRGAFLPPGVHDASLPDVRAAFAGTAAPCRRRFLFGVLTATMRHLSGYDHVCDVYLVGSFTTSKAEPKDVDVRVVTQGNRRDRHVLQDELLDLRASVPTLDKEPPLDISVQFIQHVPASIALWQEVTPREIQHRAWTPPGVEAADLPTQKGIVRIVSFP